MGEGEHLQMGKDPLHRAMASNVELVPNAVLLLSKFHMKDLTIKACNCPHDIMRVVSHPKSS